MSQEAREITYAANDTPNSFGWEWKAWRTPVQGDVAVIGWGATKDAAKLDLEMAEQGMDRGPRPEAIKI